MRATLDDLLNRKVQAEADRNAFKDIEIPALNMTLVFQKLPVSRILSLINDIQDDSGNLNNNFEACTKLIYDCCPILHDPKLHEGLGEPYDVVSLVFNDNIEAITLCAANIVTEFYGSNPKDVAVNDLKNA